MRVTQLLLSDPIEECHGIKEKLGIKLRAARLGKVRQAWQLQVTFGQDRNGFVREILERTRAVEHPIRKCHRRYLLSLFQDLADSHPQLTQQQLQQQPEEMVQQQPPQRFAGAWIAYYQQLVQRSIKVASGIGDAIGDRFRLDLGVTTVFHLVRYFAQICNCNVAFFVYHVQDLFGIQERYWHHLVNCGEYLLEISKLIWNAASLVGNAMAAAVTLMIVQNFVAIGGI